MNVTTTVALSLKAAMSKTFELDGSLSASPKVELSQKLENGNGDDKANQEWADEGTLAASADVDLDLSGGLTDRAGDTVTFTKIKAILIYNTSDLQGTPTEAEIHFGGGDGGDGTNAFDTWITSLAPGNAGSEALKVHSGGAIALYAPKDGYAVTAATGDILRIKNNDGTYQAAYRIIIVGVV